MLRRAHYGSCVATLVLAAGSAGGVAVGAEPSHEVLSVSPFRAAPANTLAGFGSTALTTRVIARCVATRPEGSSQYAWYQTRPLNIRMVAGGTVNRGQLCDAETANEKIDSLYDPPAEYVYQDRIIMGFNVMGTMGNDRSGCGKDTLCRRFSAGTTTRLPVTLKYGSEARKAAVAIRFGRAVTTRRTIYEGSDDFINVCINQGRLITSSGGELRCTIPARSGQVRVTVAGSRR